MVPLFPAAYSRNSVAGPEQRCLNMYYERSPGGPGPVLMMQRPGLIARFTPGSEIRAIFKQNIILGGDTIYVAGNTLYRNSTPLGTIATTSGRCEIAASPSHFVVLDVDAATAYDYTGALTEITDVNLPDVVSVASYAGRWFFAQLDSGTFWWSAIGDPTSIDPLAFSSVGHESGKIERLIVVGDDLIIVCRERVEFWYSVADADQPVRRYSNRTFSKGGINGGAVLTLDNTLFWLGSERMPYRAEGVPRALIDPATGAGYGIAERLRDSTISEVQAWKTAFDGHEFFCLNIEGTTWAYDVSTGQWSEWSIDICCSGGSDEPFVGGPEGIVYQFQSGRSLDNEATFDRISSAFVPVEDGVPRCDEVVLALRSSKEDGTSGESDVQLRYWDNRTVGWSDWIDRQSVNQSVRWRQLNLMRAPGRYFEFRCQDDDRFVGFSSLKINPRRA